MATISNRRAGRDYDLGPSLTAGIVLSGAEVKAIRAGRVSLTGSYVRLDQTGVWLINLQIQTGLAENQVRHKLLLTKAQIDRLHNPSSGRTTVVPLSLTIGRYIKVVIAPARGRKKYDKRQALAQRRANRTIEQRLKQGRR